MGLAVEGYEKFNWDFFKWIWNYPKDIKPPILKIRENNSKGKMYLGLTIIKK